MAELSLVQEVYNEKTHRDKLARFCTCHRRHTSFSHPDVRSGSSMQQVWTGVVSGLGLEGLGISTGSYVERATFKGTGSSFSGITENY